MGGRLEIHRWLTIKHPAYAVAMSDNGQLIAVGAETGVLVFNLAGRLLLTYSPAIVPTPIRQLATTPDMSHLYVGTLEGHLICLELERVGETLRSHPHYLYQVEHDLHSLALVSHESSGSQSNTGPKALIALGHYGPALTVLDASGALVWRRHPDDGSATEGQFWTVALAPDGSTLYAGCAGPGINRLAALTAQTGARQAAIYLEGQRVTGLTPLSNQAGVVLALIGNDYTSQLAAYPANLSEVMWQYDFSEPITALAANQHQPLLVIGVGYEGQVMLIETQQGQVLATESLKVTVTGLALAQGGRALAAATQDGSVALIHYLPKEADL